MRSFKSKFVSACAWGLAPALAAVLPSHALELPHAVPAGKILHYGTAHSLMLCAPALFAITRHLADDCLQTFSTTSRRLP
jgi:hypothetical protein